MRSVLRWPAAISLVVVCSATAWVSACAALWATVLLSEPDGFFRTPFCLLNPNCPPVVACGWSEGCEISYFLISGLVQVVGLALVLASTLVIKRLMRPEEYPPFGAWRKVIRRNSVIWALGVAVIALVDLAIYIVVWIRWAHCRVEEYAEPFVFPTEQVVTGALMALAVTGAAVTLAVCLWRRGRRRDRASRTSVSSEA